MKISRPVQMVASCVAILVTILAPVSVNAALAVEVSQAPTVIRSFDNGSRMEVRPGQGGSISGTRFSFKSSTGEVLESRIRQFGRGLFRVEFDEAISVEFSLRLVNGVARFEETTLRVFDEAIPINPAALNNETTQRKLERAQSVLTARYSKTLMNELAEAGAAIGDSPQRLGAEPMTGEVGVVTGELRSRDALHCAGAVVAWGGSVISLTLCATILFCTIAVLLHSYAGGSAIGTCTSWLLNERFDNCVEAGGDPDQCEAEIPGNNDTDT